VTFARPRLSRQIASASHVRQLFRERVLGVFPKGSLMLSPSSAPPCSLGRRALAGGHLVRDAGTGAVPVHGRTTWSAFASPSAQPGVPFGPGGPSRTWLGGHSEQGCPCRAYSRNAAPYDDGGLNGWTIKAPPVMGPGRPVAYHKREGCHGEGRIF